MEAVSYAVRANLRRLLRLHPHWTQNQYAQAVGMSVGWVKKWKHRLQQADPEDEQVLHSRSRARIYPPERLSEVVVDRILQMRDEPPEGVRRTPGPKAILYDLPRDEQLAGERLPRSSRTVYRILPQAGRIAHRERSEVESPERAAPLSQWQLDFKDASTVPPQPDGKRPHVVEVLNAVDEGTSILLEAQVRTDFQAETTLEAVAELFGRQGMPQRVRRDREVLDPDRWVQVYDGLHLVRRVRHDGSVRVDLKRYYAGRAWAGRRRALQLSAADGALLVIHERRVIKSLPLQGLVGKTLSFEAFVQLMQGQARAERRLRTDQQRRLRLGSADSP